MENTIIVAVKGIILHHNKALIVKRALSDDTGGGTWEFPGGKLEFGEALEDALIREVQEETGLNISVMELLYAATFFTNAHRQLVVLTYLCTTNEIDVTLSTEHDSYLWAKKDEMETMLFETILEDLHTHDIFDYLQLS